VIGAMTQGVGAAPIEELVVDKRAGFFVNHDLAGYEVPVHADIPHQDVIFLDEPDTASSPMKAKGVAELGICGVAAAIANAIHNATGVRLRDYPITLDKKACRQWPESCANWPLARHSFSSRGVSCGYWLQRRQAPWPSARRPDCRPAARRPDR
jgi:hypothetical protein